MPEGPEVRTVYDSIHRNILSKTLIGIEWNSSSRYHTKPPKNYEFVHMNFPCTILEVRVKGKKIIFALKSIENTTHLSASKIFYIVIFLGMTGGLFYEKKSHSNLWFNIKDDESNDFKLYFNDQRKFGRIDFYPDDQSLSVVLKKMGPDLLAYALFLKGIDQNVLAYDHITPERWSAMLSTRWVKNMKICDYLLEQKYVLGIGAYLRSEILYFSKINPTRLIKDLTPDERELIRVKSLEIIYDSYISQGHTMKDYFTPEGKAGSFKCQIYDESTCPCGHVIEKMFSRDRGIYWCPIEQI